VRFVFILYNNNNNINNNIFEFYILDKKNFLFINHHDNVDYFDGLKMNHPTKIILLYVC